MTRFNLWVTLNDHSKVICHGSQDTMNDIALTAGIEGDVHVLPDGEEPCPNSLQYGEAQP